MKNSWWPPVFAFLVVLAALEAGTSAGIVNAALIPPPSQLWQTFFELQTDFLIALKDTTANTLLGLAAAFVLGSLLALLLSLWSWGRKAILPFAIFFQTVPIIAIAPLLVIYLGFGSGTVVASSLIVAIFPVLASTLLGLQSVDPGEIELFRLYRASRWQTLWRLQVPRAYPSVYAGLKIAIGLSVIGTVAGEFVAGGGLGALIDSARTQQRIDIVFVALLLLSALGLVLIGLLRFTHRAIQRIRPYGLFLKD